MPIALTDKGLGVADAARMVTVALAPENRPMIDNNAIIPSDGELLDLARAVLAAR